MALATLDDPERLGAFRGRLLDRAQDDELQRIVAEAARLTDFPIALVSLVLRRVQFFRAHVGLPQELAISRATDRCVSYCQYVVGRGVPLSIPDAAIDAMLPQDLVDTFGVRAYFGFPLKVQGHVLGSLCVIDTKPHELTDAQRAAMEELQRRTNVRLEELASESLAAHQWTVAAVQPAFGELRNVVAALSMNQTYHRVALAELASISQLLVSSSNDELQFRQLRNAASVLVEAQSALSDLTDSSRDAESLISRITVGIGALQASLLARPSNMLAEALDIANRNAHHLTKLVGGVRLPEVDPTIVVRAGRIAAANVLAGVLALLANQAYGLGATAAGIDVHVDDGAQLVTLRFSLASLAHADYEAIASQVSMTLVPFEEIAVDATRDALLLAWRKQDEPSL